MRCQDCSVEERCEGLHINAIRHLGLQRLQPLRGQRAAEADQQLRALHPQPLPTPGTPLQAVADSLPGALCRGSSRIPWPSKRGCSSERISSTGRWREDSSTDAQSEALMAQLGYPQLTRTAFSAVASAATLPRAWS